VRFGCAKPLACSQILCGYATRWRRKGQEKRKNPDGETSLTALRKAASRNENQVSTILCAELNETIESVDFLCSLPEKQPTLTNIPFSFLIYARVVTNGIILTKQMINEK
jgi:hypothetical protein